jgi:hypothetical protein
MSDAMLEQLIDQALAEYLAAEASERAAKWERFKQLHASRSDRQVHRMEAGIFGKKKPGNALQSSRAIH